MSHSTLNSSFSHRLARALIEEDAFPKPDEEMLREIEDLIFDSSCSNNDLCMILIEWLVDEELLELSEILTDRYLVHLGKASWPEKTAFERGRFISRLLGNGVTPLRIVEGLRSHISEVEIVEILAGVPGLTEDICRALGPLGKMLTLRRRRGTRARLMWHVAVLTFPSCFDSLPVADVPYNSLCVALDDWPYRQAGSMMKLVDMGAINHNEQFILEAFGKWLNEFLLDNIGLDIEAIWRESPVCDAARAKVREIFSGDDFLANFYLLPGQ